MADDMKGYSGNDRSAIIEGLRSKVYSLSRNEMIAIAVAVVLSILSFSLCIALGVQVNRTLSAESKVTKLQAECQDKMCLEAAAWSLANLNSSVAPCDNFYQYACGGYKLVVPADVWDFTIDVKTDLMHRNWRKIQKLLLVFPERKSWPAIELLRLVFRSCQNIPAREVVKGKPLVDLLTSRLGGWSVLGNWDQAAFNLTSLLKVTQGDLWTDVFWKYEASPDRESSYFMNVLRIMPSINRFYHPISDLFNHTDKERKEKHKSKMRNLARLLQRDAKITMQDDVRAQKVEEFIDDMEKMEMQLTMAAGKWDQFPSYVTLKQLTEATKNEVDIQTVAMNVFGDSIDAMKPIQVINLDYFNQLGTIIKGLPPQNKIRMIHNYIVGRVVESFSTELSADYTVHGRPHWLCYGFASSFMDDIVQAAFILDHFADISKEKVTDIADTMKTAMMNSISDNPWMDSTTKSALLAKAQKTVFEIGYPDYLMHPETLTSKYKSLKFNHSDHFGHVVQARGFIANELRHTLLDVNTRDNWVVSVTEVTTGANNRWNDVDVPAGLLQFPLYDYQLPHYMTFGSLGPDIGRSLVSLFDLRGRMYDEDGVYTISSLWTQATVNAYRSFSQCIANFYSNKSMGPFFNDSGFPFTFPLQADTIDVLAQTSGVRVAYKAYQLWEQDKGKEKRVPGLNLDNTQVFFLRYAQSYCFDYPFERLSRDAQNFKMTDEYRVNMVLQQLEEFSEAFSCPSGSAMNPPGKCQLY